MTLKKIKFSIKDFFNKCGQVRRKLWIWSYLLKKSLMENFIFCRVEDQTLIPIKRLVLTKILKVHNDAGRYKLVVETLFNILELAAF